MPAKLRCALYTRKSSEEGLDQSFNSLHAQREACDAYVLSQAGEGWSALPQAYDDGGFSGGSMDRPGLRRLMADIDAGKIDVVVVYKVDRLTRSLADFAKIVEAFDARGVSFVSVTQAFNTTSSMGRLTLNVLLSFAQFEREVTGERIRDKIAASKAKGIWMGGMLSLGYDVVDRALVINEPEAVLVRHIFNRYLELGSVRELAAELEAEGVRSKFWTSRSGKPIGGVLIGRGALFHIVSSRIYLGEICHKGRVYPGRHKAIIGSELFEAVSAKLADRAVKHRNRPVRAAASVLTGKLYEAGGVLMGPSFGYGRGGKLYRYYVASSVSAGHAGDHIRRISAPAVEAFLLQQLIRLTARTDLQHADLRTCLRRVELRPRETHLEVNVGAAFGDDHPKLVLAALLRRMVEGEDAVLEAGSPPVIRVVLPVRMQLRGGKHRIVGLLDPSPQRRGSLAVVAALKRAHSDLYSLNASPFTPSDRLTDAVAPLTQHDRQNARLALLSPELQRLLLEGDQPAGLTLGALLKSPPPLAWADQPNWLRGLAAEASKYPDNAKPSP